MIVKTDEGLGFLYPFTEDVAEVLGDARLAAIDEVVRSSAVRQLRASYWAAVTGALRWDYRVRPEVLIDAAGRML